MIKQYIVIQVGVLNLEQDVQLEYMINQIKIRAAMLTLIRITLYLKQQTGIQY
jgi:hypothetical protein